MAGWGSRASREVSGALVAVCLGVGPAAAATPGIGRLGPVGAAEARPVEPESAGPGLMGVALGPGAPGSLGCLGAAELERADARPMLWGCGLAASARPAGPLAAGGPARVGALAGVGARHPRVGALVGAGAQQAALLVQLLCVKEILKNCGANIYRQTG